MMPSSASVRPVVAVSTTPPMTPWRDAISPSWIAGFKHTEQGTHINDPQQVAVDVDGRLSRVGVGARELAERCLDHDVDVRGREAESRDRSGQLDGDARRIEHVVDEHLTRAIRDSAERLGHCAGDQSDVLGIEKLSVRREPVQPVRATQLLEIDGDGAVGEVDRDQAIGIREGLHEERVAGLLEGRIEARETDRPTPGLDGDETDVEVERGRLSDLAQRTLGTDCRIESGAHISHGRIEIGAEPCDQRRADHQLPVGDHVVRGDLAFALRRRGAERSELQGELVDDLIAEPVHSSLRQQGGQIDTGAAVGAVLDAIDVQRSAVTDRPCARGGVHRVRGVGVARHGAHLSQMQESGAVLVADQREGDGAEIQFHCIAEHADVQGIRVLDRVAGEAGLARPGVGQVEREHISVDDSTEGLGLIRLGGQGRQAEEGETRRGDRRDDTSEQGCSAPSRQGRW